MPSNPSPNLRIELQETGESLNSWGSKLNQGLVLHEQAICGVLIKPLTGNYTLTVQNYVTDEARNAVLIFTAGSGLAAAPTVTVPPAPKSWHVDNRTGYPITFTMGGSPVTVPVGRQADVFCDGTNLFMLEPIAAASAVTEAFAQQAATSALTAMTSASTATLRRDQALTARDETYTARDQAFAYRNTTLGYRDAAAVSASQAANSAAGVNLPAVSAADAGKALVVKPDGSGYVAQAIAQAPIYPIYISSPAAGVTATASQTFTALASGYGADTLGYYSLYGFPQASRTLNVYTTSAPSVIFKSQTASGAGNSLTVNLGALGLSLSTQYLAEMVFTDAAGNTQRTAKVQFTTPAQFRPNFGESYQGGFYTGQINDGGTVYDVIVSPKASGETTAVWDTQSIVIGAPSRTNGPANSANPTATQAAVQYCRGRTIGGFTDWYLPAIDELELAYRNLKPTTDASNTAISGNQNSVPVGSAYTAGNPGQTAVTAFRAGGAEALKTDLAYWSSSEVDATNARGLTMTNGSQNSLGKSSALNVRAVRRVAA